jgi:type I restriction-modification system DNA methylase subunit
MAKGKVKNSDAKTSYKNGNGGLAELLKELWNAAVALRGSIEPSDYKRYVLPLIFLRFLSLRYEKRVTEIDAEIADPKSDLFTTDKQLALEMREDPDNFKKKNVFLVPEDACWDNIVKIARADDIKLKLDNILALLEKTFPKLKGLLPPIYAGSNLDKEGVAGLINLFSKDIFRAETGGVDMLGRVYEYFIGEFANSEGKCGGGYFTPQSIVQMLVAMLEPIKGKVFDPCCGSGGMFVQSDTFTHHSGILSFFGQEFKEFTFRLCRLNLFIHGIDGDIKPGSSYTNDQHADLKADYHSIFFTHDPDALTQLGWALKFYDISFLYAPTPQAKGKVEREHQFWQGRLPACFASEKIIEIEVANPHIDDLRAHRNAQEIHRELRQTPQRAWDQARKEKRSVRRPAPRCP